MSLGLIYEVIPECNLKCSFCYNQWPQSSLQQAYLSLSQIEQLFGRVLMLPGLEWLTLTGGEPLLRGDLEEIIGLAHRSNPSLRLGLTTNGTLLDEQRCLNLVRAGLTHFEISLYAKTPQGFDELCSCSALEKVHQAILNAKRAGAFLTVSLILTQFSASFLAELIQVAFALGADRLALNRFVPTGKAKLNENKFALSTSQLTGLLEIAQAEAQRLNQPIDITIPIPECEISNKAYPNLRFSACHCGEAKWAIDPWGNLRACEQSTEAFGNLLEDEFAALSCKQQVKTFREFYPHTNCSSCQSRASCLGGCRFLCTQE